ncbi:MAG: hypothetical protein H6706_02125 [Myxococcales bacterium]|nr:hypothetical protein [Myxococcales bacterium]
MRRAATLAVALLAGACTNTSRKTGDAPPEGLPWLATTYAVELTLVGSDCHPGGQDPEVRPATAEIYQDGDYVEWRQLSTAVDGDFWYLTGALCPRDGGSVLRLAGGRRDTVNGCQARTTIPAVGEPNLDDPCAGDGRLELVPDEDGCGGLHLAEASAQARISFHRDCSWKSACTLELTLKATPLTRDPRAPAPPEGCATP